jgi:hypothetical protein
MEWWLALAALIIGVTAGFIFGRIGDASRKRAETLQNELDSVNVELNEYRGRVTRHFTRTAELVDALAANSREIYNHLAEGSQKLCDANTKKIDQETTGSLPTQATEDTVVKDSHIKPDAAVEKPDEGWYEILPETDERKVEEPVH